MAQTHMLGTDRRYRTTLAGPIAAADDGRLLWLVSGPVFPRPGIFHLCRAELRESADGGRTWDEGRVLLAGTREYAQIPSAMLRLRSGRILLTFVRFGGFSPDLDPAKSLCEGWAMFSDDGGGTWSAPSRLPARGRYQCPPLSMTQLSSGRVVYPYGLMTGQAGKSVVSALVSDDEGATWQVSPSVLDVGGAGMESGALEPSVVELPDGRVWMLLRTQHGCQWESFSHDGGLSWSAPQPSSVPSGNAPAVLVKLADGRILLAWNPCVDSAYARHSLMLAVSDDGRAFYGGDEIAHTDYPLTATDVYWGVMYPYVAQLPNGDLTVAFNEGDWNFQQAHLVRVDRAWLGRREIVEDFRDGLTAWCSLGSSSGSAQLVDPDDDQAGAALRVEDSGAGPAGIVRAFPLLTEGKVTLTLSVHKPSGYLLFGDVFLYAGQVRSARLRVRFADGGRILVGAGSASRVETSVADHVPWYAHTAFPIGYEVEYPQPWPQDRRFDLVLQLSKGQAGITVDSGPEVALELGSTLGLWHLGLAADQHGAVTLRRARWTP
ncbi:MAG: exo-alpha-sialidase [Phycisphaerae bacterium]|nr:exo-alpha-sialidase [Phycisphaerae bacterium]